MNEFRTARIKLTIWYLCISLAMLTIFSLAAISAEKRSFGKIQAVLNNKIERPRLTLVLERRIDNFESDFLRRLLFFDVVLLGFSAGASWFLSGKTLIPIQIMVKNQEAFAEDVSHELRTPLTTVNMEIEALKRTNPHVPKQYLLAFDSIQDEIKRMSNLVEGLLMTVRTNEQLTQFEPINVSQIAEETCAKLQLLTQAQQIQYSSKIEKDIFVKADPDSIKRLITIFIDNAILYTPEKGKIVTDLKKTSKSALFIVTNTGAGISERDLPHIFERFYRGSSYSAASQQMRHKGTGLGLNIAQKILDQIGGSIQVESKPNQGATFTAYLPLAS